MLTFALVLLGFLAVGWAAARRQRGATDDYYLASRNLSPWLVGLSAVATNNSGYMFIGVIGFTYEAPLDAVYLMVGWLAGDALATARVHGALQRRSHAEGARSFLSLLLPPGASPGASVLGQPHVMVRFMTLAPGASIVLTRLWYYLWFCVFYGLASAVGLLSRAFFAGGEPFDPELAMPRLAVEVLPAGFEGVLLAGVFAATLSTADSLLLGASAALTQDAFPQLQRSKVAAKSATLGLLVVACLLAWAQPSSVFQLVVFSWSGLASAFAPLLIARLARWNYAPVLAWLAPLLGLGTAVLWRLAGWHTAFYEGAPGMLLGLGLLMLGRQRLRGQPRST